MKLRLRKPVWDEKRRAQRLDLERSVTWQLQKKKFMIFSTWEDPSPAVLQKPSADGLRLLTEESVAEGSRIRIQVPMEGWSNEKASVSLLGEVVWSELSGKSGKYAQGIRLQPGAMDHPVWENFMFSKLREFDKDPVVMEFNP